MPSHTPKEQDKRRKAARVAQQPAGRLKRIRVKTRPVRRA